MEASRKSWDYVDRYTDAFLFLHFQPVSTWTAQMGWARMDYGTREPKNPECYSSDGKVFWQSATKEYHSHSKHSSLVVLLKEQASLVYQLSSDRRRRRQEKVSPREWSVATLLCQSKV